MCQRCGCGDDINREKPTVKANVRLNPIFRNEALTEFEMNQHGAVVERLSDSDVEKLLLIQARMLDRQAFLQPSGSPSQAKYRGLFSTSSRNC